MPPTRRAFLGALGVGALVVGGLGTAALRRRGRPAGAPADLESLVDAIARSSQQEILGVAAAAMERGASLTDLLHAAFLAPLLTGGDGEDVHAMLVVPSIEHHLLDVRPGQGFIGLARVLPVFWAVSNAQLWCQKDRRPPPVVGGGGADPSAALDGALEAQDPEGAAVAVTALVDRLGVDAAAKRLRLEASRPRADPHGAIFAAQGTRALPTLPAAHAASLLRSVARYLARTGPPEPDSPEAIRFDPEDRTPPLEIAAALAGAPRLSLTGFSQGVIWEALAWLALDGRVAEPRGASGAGVHQTTLLDALWFLHDQAPPASRDLVLTRAVRALGALRRPAPLRRGFPSFEELRGARSAIGHDPRRFIDEARREVALKGTGEHDFKYFAAVESVAPRLPRTARDAWWSALALAHPIGSAERWHRTDEVIALSRRLGG